MAVLRGVSFKIDFTRTVSGGGSGCSFGFKLIDGIMLLNWLFGLMTRVVTLSRPLEVGGVGRGVDSITDGVDTEGVTVSAAPTGLVTLVLSLFSPP